MLLVMVKKEIRIIELDDGLPPIFQDMRSQFWQMLHALGMPSARGNAEQDGGDQQTSRCELNAYN